MSKYKLYKIIFLLNFNIINLKYLKFHVLLIFLFFYAIIYYIETLNGETHDD